MSSVCWEWKRDGSLDKEILVRYGARGASTYGIRYEYDQKAPDEFETFEAHGCEWARDVLPLITESKKPLDQQTAGTYTDRDGHQWGGKIYGLKWTAIGQGCVLYDMTLKLKNPTYFS